MDLQDDQITNITPIVEKYSIAFRDLNKSIEDGTINPSAIDNQRQGLEDSETHELSVYLKPDQLSLWRQMQGQIDQPGTQEEAETDSINEEYSNLPNR